MPGRKKAYDMSTPSDGGGEIPHASLRDAMKKKRRSLLSVFSSENSGGSPSKTVSRNTSFHSNAASEAPSVLEGAPSDIRALAQDLEVTIENSADVYNNTKTPITGTMSQEFNSVSTNNNNNVLTDTNHVSASTQSSTKIVQKTITTTTSTTSTTEHESSAGDLDLRSRDKPGVADENNLENHSDHVYTSTVAQQAASDGGKFYSTTSKTNTSIINKSHNSVQNTETNNNGSQNSLQMPEAGYEKSNRHSTHFEINTINTKITTSNSELTDKLKNESPVGDGNSEATVGVSNSDQTCASNSTVSSQQGLYIKSETSKEAATPKVASRNTSLKQRSNSFKAEIQQLLQSRFNSLERSQVQEIDSASESKSLVKSVSSSNHNSTNQSKQTSRVTKSLDRKHNLISTTKNVESSERDDQNNHASDNNAAVITRSRLPSSKNERPGVGAESGTVERLAKSLFKNITLTGGCMPNRPTSPPPRAGNTDDPTSSPLSTLSPTSPQSPDNNKRYTYLVEGIDIPATTDSASDLVGSSEAALEYIESTQRDSATRVEASGTQKLKKTEEKGFTYLLDKALAKEIKRRAEEADQGRRAKEEEQRITSSNTELTDVDGNDGGIDTDELNIDQLKSVFEGSQISIANKAQKSEGSKDRQLINHIKHSEEHAPFVEAKNRYLAELTRKQNKKQSSRSAIGDMNDLATHGVRKTLVISHEQLATTSSQNNSSQSKSERNRVDIKQKKTDIYIQQTTDPNNNAKYDIKSSTNFTKASPVQSNSNVGGQVSPPDFASQYVTSEVQQQQLSPNNNTTVILTNDNQYASSIADDVRNKGNTFYFEDNIQTRGDKPQARVIPLQPPQNYSILQTRADNNIHPAVIPDRASRMASQHVNQSQGMNTLRSNYSDRSVHRNSRSESFNSRQGFPSTAESHFKVSAKPSNNYSMVIHPSDFLGNLSSNMGDREVETFDAYPESVRFDGNKYATLHHNDVYKMQLEQDDPNIKGSRHTPVNSINNVFRMSGGYDVEYPVGASPGNFNQSYDFTNDRNKREESRLSWPAPQAYQRVQSGAVSPATVQSIPLSPRLEDTKVSENAYKVTLNLNNTGIATNVQATEFNMRPQNDTSDLSKQSYNRVNNFNAPHAIKNTQSADGMSSSSGLYYSFSEDVPLVQNRGHYTEVKRYEAEFPRRYQNESPLNISSHYHQQPANRYSIHSDDNVDQIPSGHVTNARMSVNNSRIRHNVQQQPPPPLHQQDRNSHVSRLTPGVSEPVPPQYYYQNSSQEAPAMHITKVFHKTDDPDIKRTSNVPNLQSNDGLREYSEDLGRYFTEDPTDDIDGENEYSDEDEKPMDVVRGTFLIKNAIDTTSAAKVYDFVEPDDEDTEVVVDDNANLFHSRYLTNRENPMYDSNPDLNRIDEFLNESKPDHVYTQTTSDGRFTTMDNGQPSFVVPDPSFSVFAKNAPNFYSKSEPTHTYVTRIETQDNDEPDFESTRIYNGHDQQPGPTNYSRLRPNHNSRDLPSEPDRGVYSTHLASTPRSRYQSAKRPNYHQQSYSSRYGRPDRGQYRPYTRDTRPVYGDQTRPDPTSSSWHYQSEYGKPRQRLYSAPSVAGSMNTEMEMNMGKGRKHETRMCIQAYT